MFTVTDVNRRLCTSATSPFMVTVAALSKAIEQATMPAGSFCDGSGGYRFVDRAGAHAALLQKPWGRLFRRAVDPVWVAHRIGRLSLAESDHHHPSQHLQPHAGEPAVVLHATCGR